MIPMNIHQWHAVPLAECIRELGSDRETGLPGIEARRRLARYGENRIVEGAKVHPVRLFLAQFSDFMVLVLLGAGTISFFLGEVVDGLAIVAILLLNALFGFIQEYKAEQSLQALQRLASPVSTVIRDGTPVQVPASELVPGDLVLIRSGDRVPADGRLVEGQSLEVDESLLTGESVPVSKSPEHVGSPAEPLAERKNMLFMGTVVTRGRATFLVTATGMKTQMGEIAALIRSTQTEATPLQRRLESLGKRLVAACFVLVACVFVAGVLRGFPMYRMFLTGVSLAVAAIPEGLPAVVTAALAIGVQRMIRRKAIVRRLPAVETLGCTTVICTDKTGTLTQNEMTVVHLWVADREVTVTGTGYVPKGEFRIGAERINPLEDPDLRRLLEIGVRCNNAVLMPGRSGVRTAVDRGSGDNMKVIGDPTEGALLVAGAKGGLDARDLAGRLPLVLENPFDPQRRRMSVVVRSAGRRVSFVKGAPGALLERCTHIRQKGETRPMTPALQRRISAQVTRYANQALRVMAFAYRDLPGGAASVAKCEENLVFVGLAALFDPPRPEVRRAVQLAQRAGVRTLMLTGDHPATAAAVGNLIGLVGPEKRVLTGQEIDAMDDRELAAACAKVSCFARVSPRHKLRIVQSLRRQGEIVAMTGDGVNDAPAVKEADIGIAMGRTGADVTKEAADMVLADDNYATIVAAIEEGRAIFDNIRKFIRYLLGCNAGEVMAMLVALLVGLPLPLLPLQILWMNLVTDGLPALALGVDPGDKGIMQRPPRSAREGIFARGLWKKILFSGVMIGSSTLLAFGLALWLRPDAVEWARTIAFTTLVVAQLIYAFQCRSEYQSAFEVGLFGNPHLVGAVLCSLIMQGAVVYWQPLASVFGTVPLSGTDWLIVVLFSAWSLLFGWLTRVLRTHLFRRFAWVRVASQ